MSPIGSIHEVLVDRLNRWSCTNTTEDQVQVRVQNSVGFNELDSAPEPDVVWARGKDYSHGRPLASDVLLVIEVADTGLVYDRGEKAKLFSTAGIADYWIVNIPDRCVEVLRQPRGARYQHREVFFAKDEIRPLAFPEVVLQVGMLFRLDS
jgi:Uma2 family endonuclease